MNSNNLPSIINYNKRKETGKIKFCKGCNKLLENNSTYTKISRDVYGRKKLYIYNYSRCKECLYLYKRQKRLDGRKIKADNK